MNEMAQAMRFGSSWKTAEEARTFWNSRARDYNTRSLGSARSREELIESYLSMGVLTRDSRVLDLGCGPGNYTRLLS